MWEIILYKCADIRENKKKNTNRNRRHTGAFIGCQYA